MKKINKEALLIDYVEELDEKNVIKLSEELLNFGMPPFTLWELINAGMKKVGKLYESKDYYIADLIMAGLIFKEVLKLDTMQQYFLSSNYKRIGKIVIGTVKGDIHDIGKEIFRSMMETNGFEVIDLGVDVDREVFVKKVTEHKPDILGLSGVLTYTANSMKDVVVALTEAGIRDKVKILLGGDHLTQEVCAYAGADNFATDASFGVKLCREWMQSMNRQGAVDNG